MKNLILLLFSAGLTIQASTAQDNSDETDSGLKHYLLFGFGYVHETIYDEAISKLRYQRGGVMPDFGYMRFSTKSINRFQLNASYLNLRSDERSDLIASKVSSIEFGFDYDHLRLIKSLPDEWDWYVGGRANLLFDLKQAPQLDNSSILYDYALNLGASAAFKKSWQWEKRNPYVLLQLNIPLIAHISRPPYLNRIEFIDVKNELIGDFFRHSEFTSLNGFFRLQTQAEFYYPIRGNNLLKLSYRWDYYRMKTFNRAFQGEQQLVLSFMMNL